MKRFIDKVCFFTLVLWVYLYPVGFMFGQGVTPFNSIRVSGLAQAKLVTPITTNVTTSAGGALTIADGGAYYFETYAGGSGTTVTFPSIFFTHYFDVYLAGCDGVTPIIFTAGANVYRYGDPNTAITTFTPGPAGNHHLHFYAAIGAAGATFWYFSDDCFSVDYITATGSANAFVATPVPPMTAYVANSHFRFKANFSITGSTTINISGLGAITIQKYVAGALANLVSGDIVSGQECDLAYDGTVFQLQSPLATPATGSTSFANPTATVGPTAVNGAATTAMRSDASPALNQGTNYTLTGNNIIGALQTSDAVVLGNTIQTIASGTAYTLTNAMAAVAFGTTSPIVTINSPGTYIIAATVQTHFVGATFASVQTINYKLRRTNNTATDVSGSVFANNLPIVTAITSDGPTTTIIVSYTTALSTDTVQLFGNLSATPSAGSSTVSAVTLTAYRTHP